MDSNPAVPESPDRRKQAYALLAVGCVLMAMAFVIGLTDNPPGILSLLLGGFAFIMGIFYRFAKPKGRKPAHEFLYWAPRALCIAFALFTSVFALDVFEEGQGLWTMALAFIMHLTPTFILLLLLALSWRWEWIGGYLFVILAAFYVVTSWGKPFAVWWSLLLMAGPVALTGVLFLINWYNRDTLRGGSH